MLTETKEKIWQWRGYNIPYQTEGDNGPAVVLVHGFGACWGHWRKNIPVIGETCRCYALDLIGFGGADKPAPGGEISYTFETWGQQVADFCREVVGEKAFLVGNSIGCIVIMQTAVDFPELVLGIAALNCSLRLLHERKRSEIPWYRSMGADFAQGILKNRTIGTFFFNSIAKPNNIRKILLQAYKRKEAVTDELVQMLLAPAYTSGAAGVFLAFTGYSGGPLPEDLLPRLTCPTILLWGMDDPWEPIELGKKLGDYETVDEFIELPGSGHCPQDEDPETVNPLILQWIDRTVNQP
ncbi:MAG: 4,5:9,10-diseco-3-hydroxy-5,9,17-trioxoandrosta-1(10),2-diene-4-oate hydrolase [Chroococcopsis gigantea SAG 12.99]|jgi:pimeloyl-ACP methyl ester carboxylesterase|nr:4,5:9,10-diseco-3-hydroxy-5,9,17-trioxoandrosta-1(10),2-diene-4-oate hydrolase [Chroococcopsis gigantea SAG 12.99]